jgi:hypothetical protein
MPMPADLREQSRLSRQAGMKEETPEIKLRLASHAFALAQLAEKIERQAASAVPVKAKPRRDAG